MSSGLLLPGNAADKTSASAQVFSANLSAPVLIASGLSGATATSRYVGATTSGSPSSGTFSTGDYVVDQAGNLWVCSTAGSPGTWTKVGSLVSCRRPYTFNISGTPQVTSADENPYPGFQIAIPAGQVKKLYGVAAVAPSATSGATYKIRRYTSGSWADISGFGTIGSPLTSGAGTGSGTVTAPGTVTLADGDILGLWIVGTGSGATGLRVTLFIDEYGA